MVDTGLMKLFQFMASAPLKQEKSIHFLPTCFRRFHPSYTYVLISEFEKENKKEAGER